MNYCSYCHTKLTTKNWSGELLNEIYFCKKCQDEYKDEIIREYKNNNRGDILEEKDLFIFTIYSNKKCFCLKCKKEIRSGVLCKKCEKTYNWIMKNKNMRHVALKEE